jgi:hypothetical protein
MQNSRRQFSPFKSNRTGGKHFKPCARKMEIENENSWKFYEST